MSEVDGQDVGLVPDHHDGHKVHDSMETIETGIPGPSTGSDRWHVRAIWIPSVQAAAVGAVVLLGIALRVFILTHSLRVADSDESVTGLMARHLTHLPVFAWKTNYAGNFETALIGVPFTVFGSSVALMKVTVTSLHVLACLLVWRIGRRLVDERAGVVAGLALWIWPGVYVWWSTKARDYEVLLICGLATLLCAARLIDEPRHRRDWLWFGLAAGIGWWTNPQIAYLAAPALLWILIANRAALRSILWAAPTFLVGAAPWLAWNVRYHWGSLHSSFESTEGYTAHLHRFWAEGLPVALGLRTPYSLRWVFSEGHTVLVLAVAVAVFSLVTRRRGAALLAVALLAYPLIHALTPVAGYTGEGRYLYLFAPLLALVVGHAARNWAATLVVLVLMVAVTVGQLSTMGSGVSGLASGRPIPEDMGPLVRTLRSERIDAVWADYWIAYRLTFVSGETVIASAVAGNRWPPYEEHVRRSTRSAWVYVVGSVADQHFTAALDQKQLPYRTLRPGGFAVHIPSRPILPGEVPLD